jgi:PAS domain-containing protein
MRENPDPRLGDLRSIAESCSTPVLLKDEEGFCTFANGAGEALFLYEPGQLAGVHMNDLGPVDPGLIWHEFERLKRERVWQGRYPIRRGDGRIIQVAASALARLGPDGGVVCAEFLYPVGRPSGRVLQPDTPVLTTREVALLQMLAEGFDDDQLSILFAANVADVREHVGATILKLGSSSRTEACVRAMKAHLIF